MMRSFARVCAFTVCLLAFSVSVSQAATVTYTANIATQLAPFTSSFTLPQFNAALGTLTGISLSLTENSTISIRVFNIGSAVEPFSNASATVPLTVTGPAATSVSSSNTAGPFSGAANPGLNTLPGVTSSSTATVVLPSSAFPSYIGNSTSTNTFTATAGSGTYTGTGSTNVLFGGAADVGGVVSITYTYLRGQIVAPEPTALALMSVGVALGGVVARRRRVA